MRRKKKRRDVRKKKRKQAPLPSNLPPLLHPGNPTKKAYRPTDLKNTKGALPAPEFSLKMETASMQLESKSLVS